MGCCCGKGSQEANEVGSSEDLELSNATNEAVLCRTGACGEKVEVMEIENKSFDVRGEGIVLGSSMLDCDIGYWEVTLGNNPKGCRVGIMRYNKKKAISLDGILQTNDKSLSSWILNPEDLDEELQPGSVIGIHWDQSDFPMVSFTIDGRLHSKASITRIRPANDLYPALSVEKDASAQIAFNEVAFQKKPWAPKFRMIVSATSML